MIPHECSSSLCDDRGLSNAHLARRRGSRSRRPAGLAVGAAVTASRLAARCPGWSVTAIELPGALLTEDAQSLEAVGRRIAATLEVLGLARSVLVAMDLGRHSRRSRHAISSRRRRSSSVKGTAQAWASGSVAGITRRVFRRNAPDPPVRASARPGNSRALRSYAACAQRQRLSRPRGSARDIRHVGCRSARLCADVEALCRSDRMHSRPRWRCRRHFDALRGSSFRRSCDDCGPRPARPAHSSGCRHLVRLCGYRGRPGAFRAAPGSRGDADYCSYSNPRRVRRRRSPA